MTPRGERVGLRPVEEADLKLLLAYLADPSVARWWGAFDEAALRAELSAPGVTAWTIVADGEPAGLVLATEEQDPDYRHADLDVFVAPHLQGRGLGPDALRAVLRLLFGERGHHRATITAAIENERAIRSYERVGFRRAGVLRRADRLADGEWHDVVLLDLLAEELEEPGAGG